MQEDLNDKGYLGFEFSWIFFFSHLKLLQILITSWFWIKAIVEEAL